MPLRHLGTREHVHGLPSFGCKMYTRNTGNESLIKPSGEPAGIKLAKEMKGLGQTRSAYFIIHVQHQLCGDQISMCRNQAKLNMYIYKVWT